MEGADRGREGAQKRELGKALRASRALGETTNEPNTKLSSSDTLFSNTNYEVLLQTKLTSPPDDSDGSLARMA